MNANVNTIKDTRGRPMRDLRISVTDRCNFRCTYCMPAEVYGERYEFLPRRDLLTYEEIVRLTKLFIGLGVSKVRLTGGEPLVRNDIEDLVRLLSALDGLEDLTLTTNGYLLGENAAKLKNAGLRRLSVSLDSLDPETFAFINGRGFPPEKVLDGIAAAKSAGLGPVKINAVIQRGVNDHTVLDMAHYFKETGHILRFIEYMDVGNINGWQRDQVVPSSEILERINSELPLKALESNYRGEVAERYAYEDGSGEIGFISSVSQPFCSDCTRVRLTPNGQVVTCLFASSGVDLREPLRSGSSDDELIGLISGIWALRDDRYSEIRAQLATTGSRKIEMYQIGG